MTDTPDDAFEAHRREQLRAWLRTSYRERLEWLEQAKRFAAKAAEAAKQRQAQKPEALRSRPGGLVPLVDPARTPTRVIDGRPPQSLGSRYVYSHSPWS